MHDKMHDVEEEVVTENVTENIESAPPDPIKLDRNQIRKLLKLGKIVPQPVRPISIGIYSHEQIMPGTFVRIDSSTFATHPDSVADMVLKAVEQNYEIRKMSRQEVRKIDRTLPSIINQLEKENRKKARNERRA